jgi:hypothetical protein
MLRNLDNFTPIKNRGKVYKEVKQLYIMNINVNGVEIDVGNKEINTLLNEWWISGECNYTSFSCWLVEHYKVI